jgi:hypothetical protein
MAVQGNEVELLGNGLQSASSVPGAFALNMIWREDAWQVRKGFGQVNQLTTTMSVNPNDGATPSTDWGYQEHLGSTLIVTDFDHEQIVSVFRADVTVSNIRGAAQFLSIYCVRIDDITARTTYEDVIYKHTSENNRDVIEMPFWHAIYESGYEKDYQDWVIASDANVFFQQYDDVLFFGSEDMGVYAYRPSVFKSNRHKFVDKLRMSYDGLGYGESSLITPSFAFPGIFSDGYAYFDRSTFSNPVDLAVIENRLVYASGRNLYFSDRNYPASIISLNTVDIGSEQSITGVVEHSDSLIVFTESETWLYRPSVGGALSSQGRLTQLSGNIGCLSSNAYATVDSTLMWIDKNGVYSMSGGFGITNISNDFSPLFTSFIKNPMTSYYVDNGWTSTTNQQPNTTVMFSSKGVNMTYSPSLRTILISMPEENVTLCYRDAKWSVWTTESVVHLDTSPATPVSDVGIQQNIKNPWYVAGQTALYLIGSLDVQSLVDSAKLQGGPTTPVNDSTRSSSYYLLQYGRGGGIDRSVEDEDNRLAEGKYVVRNNGTSVPSLFLLDKWVRLPYGYTFAASGTTVGEDDYVVAVPLKCMPVTQPGGNTWGSGVSDLDLHVYFDNENWEPIFRGATSTEIEFNLFNERAANGFGWGLTAPVAGSKEVQVYAGPAGAASQSGNYIKIHFTGTVTAGAFTNLNLTADRINNILWLPFRRKATKANLNQSGIIFTAGTTHSITDGGRGVASDCSLWAWEQMVIGNNDIRKEDSVAQPVDWAYKAVSVGLENESLKKARGLYVRMMSHGPGVAADYLFEQWVYGLCNTIVGTDIKEYMSQIIDYSGEGASAEAIQDRLNMSTIRTRIYTASGAHVDKTFGKAGVTFANPAAGSKSVGTYLIDDEEVETMATSDSAKGTSFSYMLFGHIQNRAQALYLDSIKAVFRKMGGRRRRGR